MINPSSRATVAILGALLLAAAARAQQQPAAPHAVVPVVTYSFGDIYKGETISYIFPIRNDGGADLLITDFVGACGCEALGVDKVIAPGKEGRARIELLLGLFDHIEQQIGLGETRASLLLAAGGVSAAGSLARAMIFSFGFRLRAVSTI